MSPIRLLSVAFSIFMLLIGLLVFMRNPKKAENRVFLAVCVFAALWGYTFQSIEIPSNIETVKLLNSLAYFFGGLLTIAALSFTYFFPVRKDKRVLFIYCVAMIPVLILSFTNLIAGDVNPANEAGSKYVFTVGSMAPIYILAMLAGLLLIGFNLIVKKNNYSQEQSSQAKMIAYGFFVTSIVGVGLSVIAPLIDENTPYDDLAPFALIFLISFTALAITRHKLFDFRVIIVRSLAYTLTLVTIVLVYTLVIAGVFEVLGGNNVSEFMQRILYLAVAILLGFTFSPLKHFFDKGTNRLFYRDAYETQDFLNEFNQVIVSTIDLTQLLLRAGSIIEKYIQPETVSFAVRDGQADTYRLISISQSTASKELIEQLDGHTHGNSQKLIVTDALDESAADLKQLLQEANIGMLARITTNAEVEGNGYIILGYKKSGNMYNTQDTKAMEIVTNELAIAMLNALQFEEIQKFNITLQKKIEDATHKLQHSNEKLKALDEAKDEFISMASHQLRTPLTSIKGYVSMVIEGDAGKVNPKQAELLNSAFTSSQRMVYLISDLLNVSRLRTGKFVIEAKEVYLPDVVQGEVDQLKEAVKNRKLKLIYKKPKNFPMVMLDETKIRQVIMNFADNAIYYTPAGGKITVELAFDKHSVTYKVVDTGIGVPKEEQHKLFSKFYRAGNAKKARPDGTGLGLFMAKKVVIAQGGAILFETHAGKGSTFGFIFPLTKIAVPKSK